MIQRQRLSPIALPLVIAVTALVIWQVTVSLSGTSIFPKPTQVLAGMVELIRRGVLVKYIVASLFRVSAGFLLALAIGIPFGLLLGWFSLAFQAFNPVIQILRPISPIAWIPVAILW